MYILRSCTGSRDSIRDYINFYIAFSAVLHWATYIIGTDPGCALSDTRGLREARKERSEKKNGKWNENGIKPLDCKVRPGAPGSVGLQLQLIKVYIYIYMSRIMYISCGVSVVTGPSENDYEISRTRAKGAGVSQALLRISIRETSLRIYNLRPSLPEKLRWFSTWISNDIFYSHFDSNKLLWGKRKRSIGNQAIVASQHFDCLRKRSWSWKRNEFSFSICSWT